MTMTTQETEKAIQDGLQAAREFGKEVLLPLARRFDELFRFARPASMEPGRRRARVVHRFGEAAEVHSHLSLSGHGVERRSLDVQPMPGVLAAIEKSMISSDYRITFEAVVRDNGTALILAKYDRILGDRWVAVVDAETVREIPVGDPADLYRDLVDSGADIDHHESDLYVKDSPKAREVLERHGRVLTDPKKRAGSECVHPFVSPIDKAAWIDVPFGYAPFWERKPAG